MKAKLFNFDYENGVFPNYRVEYTDGSFEVSYPALFKNKKEAMKAALEHLKEWSEIGVNTCKVLKYTTEGLKVVFQHTKDLNRIKFFNR